MLNKYLMAGAGAFAVAEMATDTNLTAKVGDGISGAFNALVSGDVPEIIGEALDAIGVELDAETIANLGNTLKDVFGDGALPGTAAGALAGVGLSKMGNQGMIAKIAITLAGAAVGNVLTREDGGIREIFGNLFDGGAEVFDKIIDGVKETADQLGIDTDAAADVAVNPNSKVIQADSVQLAPAR